MDCSLLFTKDGYQRQYVQHQRIYRWHKPKHWAVPPLCREYAKRVVYWMPWWLLCVAFWSVHALSWSSTLLREREFKHARLCRLPDFLLPYSNRKINEWDREGHDQLCRACPSKSSAQKRCCWKALNNTQSRMFWKKRLMWFLLCHTRSISGTLVNIQPVSQLKWHFLSFG